MPNRNENLYERIWYQELFQAYCKARRYRPNSQFAMHAKAGPAGETSKGTQLVDPQLLVFKAAKALALWSGVNTYDIMSWFRMDHETHALPGSDWSFIFSGEFWHYTCDVYRKVREGGYLAATGDGPCLYDHLVPYREIRLLTILPGEFDDRIICNMERSPITHPPEFQALSYEWSGENTFQETLQVNSHAVPVTSKLYMILQHLRRSDGPRKLWVDALCINQSDNAEKNIQVALMSQIYSSASRVISWVGTEEQDITQRSMLFLVRLCLPRDLRETMRAGEYPLGLPKSRSQYSLALEAREEWLREFLRGYCTGEGIKYGHYDSILMAGGSEPVDNNATTSRHTRRTEVVEHTTENSMEDASIIYNARFQRSDWIDVASFFSLSYWRRVWIIQEIVTASELRFQCGDTFVDWPVLRVLFRTLYEAGNSDYLYPHYIVNLARLPASKLLYYRLDGQSDGQAQLPSTLRRFSDALSTRTNDKVYALLGICSRSHGIEADYNLSTFELLQCLISNPSLRTDEQLIAFSQFLHHRLKDGLDPDESHQDQPNRASTLYTSGTICGSVEAIGDAFSTVEDARKLLVQWHKNYFHHIKHRRPGDELPTTIKEALSCIVEDLGRVVAIDSCLSYAYNGFQDNSRRLLPCSRKTSIVDSQPTWILGSRGQIGLLPSTAAEKDILVHFQGSDVCVVLRPSATGHECHSIVGTGLILRQWDESPRCLYDVASKVLRYSTGTVKRDSVPYRESEDRMSLHLDLECLRLLTRLVPSQT